MHRKYWYRTRCKIGTSIILGPIHWEKSWYFFCIFHKTFPFVSQNGWIIHPIWEKNGNILGKNTIFSRNFLTIFPSVYQTHLIQKLACFLHYIYTNFLILQWPKSFLREAVNRFRVKASIGSATEGGRGQRNLVHSNRSWLPGLSKLITRNIRVIGSPTGGVGVCLVLRLPIQPKPLPGIHWRLP